MGLWYPKTPAFELKSFWQMLDICKGDHDTQEKYLCFSSISGTVRLVSLVIQKEEKNGISTTEAEYYDLLRDCCAKSSLIRSQLQNYGLPSTRFLCIMTIKRTASIRKSDTSVLEDLKALSWKTCQEGSLLNLSDHSNSSNDKVQSKRLKVKNIKSDEADSFAKNYIVHDSKNEDIQESSSTHHEAFPSAPLKSKFLQMLNQK
ncbi:hypothetical protein Tco_0441875 [Tanacetum coccineum]